MANKKPTGVSLDPDLKQRIEAAAKAAARSSSSWLALAAEEKLIRETPPPYALARVVTDAAGRITDINPAFTRMCGYSLDELRGKKPGSLLQGRDTEQPVVRQFRKAIKTRQPFTCTLTNYHKNGSPYRVYIQMRPTEGGFEAEEEKLP